MDYCDDFPVSCTAVRIVDRVRDNYDRLLRGQKQCDHISSDDFREGLYWLHPEYGSCLEHLSLGHDLEIDECFLSRLREPLRKKASFDPSVRDNSVPFLIDHL